jgi:hypothetical protein
MGDTSGGDYQMDNLAGSGFASAVYSRIYTCEAYE